MICLSKLLEVSWLTGTIARLPDCHFLNRVIRIVTVDLIFKIE